MKGTWNLEGLSAAVSAATAQVSKAAAQVSKAVATEVVHGVVGAQCLLNYTVEPHASTSCCQIWSVYLARAKKEGSLHPLVSAWCLDKRALASSCGDNPRSSARRLEALVELCKRDIHQLTRLKHPGVLRLISPIEETRGQLIFLTEPVLMSLDGVLHEGGYVASTMGADVGKIELSELEIKHGLMQVSEALQFLHHDAGIAHCNISPANIVLTRAGPWKVAGFGFSVPLSVNGGQQFHGFDYGNRFPSPLGLALLPPLNYTAPELVKAGADYQNSTPFGALLSAADVFSLALVAYELACGHPLLPAASSLYDYQSRMNALSLVDFGSVPPALSSILRQMLAIAPESRPPVSAFAGCAYFLGDVHVRALKFLDSSLQRDFQQRAAFLRELPSMTVHFDRRVMQFCVLPNVISELRTPELQALALPIVISALDWQTSAEFAETSFPVLRPLLTTATGDTLLQLTQAAPKLIVAGNQVSEFQLVPKLIVRSLMAGDGRCQEEAMRQVESLADTIDYDGLKSMVLPAMHNACLATTTPAVRVAAFQALASVAKRTDQMQAEKMLETAATCIAVDKSAPTTMCVLGLGEALSRKWGVALTAERVLPVVSPLLVTPSLTSQQFQTALKTVKDMIKLIETSRSGQAHEGGANTGMLERQNATSNRAGGFSKQSHPFDDGSLLGNWRSSDPPAPVPSVSAASSGALNGTTPVGQGSGLGSLKIALRAIDVKPPMNRGQSMKSMATGVQSKRKTKTSQPADPFDTLALREPSSGNDERHSTQNISLI